MRVAVAAATTETPPPPGHALLGLAHHHDPRSAGLLRGLQERLGRLLLGDALLEPHHLQASLPYEGADVVDEPVMDRAQARGRGDVVAPVLQEAHHHPLGLQAGDVALADDAVHAANTQAHVVGQ